MQPNRDAQTFIYTIFTHNNAYKIPKYKLFAWSGMIASKKLGEERWENIPFNSFIDQVEYQPQEAVYYYGEQSQLPIYFNSNDLTLSEKVGFIRAERYGGIGLGHLFDDVPLEHPQSRLRFVYHYLNGPELPDSLAIPVAEKVSAPQ